MFAVFEERFMSIAKLNQNYFNHYDQSCQTEIDKIKPSNVNKQDFVITHVAVLRYMH